MRAGSGKASGEARLGAAPGLAALSGGEPPASPAVTPAAAGAAAGAPLGALLPPLTGFPRLSTMVKPSSDFADGDFAPASASDIEELSDEVCAVLNARVRGWLAGRDVPCGADGLIGVARKRIVRNSTVG